LAATLKNILMIDYSMIKNKKANTPSHKSKVWQPVPTSLASAAIHCFSCHRTSFVGRVRNRPNFLKDDLLNFIFDMFEVLKVFLVKVNLSQQIL
jgi:hypothetical protein